MDQSPIKGFTPSEFPFVHPQTLGGTPQARHYENPERASVYPHRISCRIVYE